MMYIDIEVFRNRSICTQNLKDFFVDNMNQIGVLMVLYSSSKWLTRSSDELCFVWVSSYSYITIQTPFPLLLQRYTYLLL